MCGRFTLHTEKELLARRYEVDLGGLDLAPRYNVAPGQLVLTVRTGDSERNASLLKWGLVPWWARPLDKLPLMINARVETVDSRRAYRDAFRARRCLVLADGFYEWQSFDRKLPKTPHWISLASGEPFAMAGLWERWQDPDEPESEALLTCTIVTAAANRAVQMIHPRMPVILPHEQALAWIDPAHDGEVDRLRALLEPVPADALHAHPVSDAVNSPANDDPTLIEQVQHPQPALF
jgi:putative SOS response-associated peptidase YedK